MRHAAVLLMLALTFGGCDWRNPFGEDPVAPPPVITPDSFLFSVAIQVSVVTVSPAEAFVIATCSPQEHPDSCSGDCVYQLQVDGISKGSALSTNSFGVHLPSRPADDYELVCLHAPTNSRSAAAHILVL